ncbi:MAG: pyridoxamine 5'-phosphate oxidase [Spirochaetia bacterium]|nr:pyridoxamine 5'-phosphate oxidase [Spirochaetia bacterium]
MPAFTEKDLTQDPLQLFAKWFAKAKRTETKNPGYDHTACSLGTALKSGAPSVRIVLLKSFDPKGFVFFTNYQSRKGRELVENPKAALCFFWPTLGRQIRVEGTISKVSAKESDAYFSSRPRGSQIGAIASSQSRPLSSRNDLIRAVKRLEKKFGEDKIPRPLNWGGFRLTPSQIEFWQAQESRLHDRFLYRKKSGKWTSERLYP